MKGIFRSNGFKILIAVVLVLLGVLIYTAIAGGSIISSTIGFVTTPLQKISTFISYYAGDMVSDRQTTDELEAKIKDLEKQVQDLRAITVDYYDLKKENAQFAKYYDLKQKNTSLKFVPASVIGRDPNENFYGFTLDEGSVAGVLENDPVITENGLVGWVYHVDANSCKVKTILSPETKVGVVDNRTGDSGVITGTLPLADQNLAKMMFVSPQNIMETGDILVTSGLSGMYPKNLQVGEVKELDHEEDDASVYAVVKPFEDIPNVRDVFIVTDFQGKGAVVSTPIKEKLAQEKDLVNPSSSAVGGQ